MQKALNLYKPVGITPLQLIDSFRQKNPEYQDVKLGFAGRLDPMAEGVMLVLVGEENKKRETYNALPKTYSFDCLFGITTDTYDALGLITDQTKTVSLQKISDHLPAVLSEIKMKTSQQYPVYSSMTVKGKPLYYWARNQRLHEISIPPHPITITDLLLEELHSISPGELRKYITDTINIVKGDFRQPEILAGWEKCFAKNQKKYIVGTCTVSCSSGTYVRSLCDEIGKNLGVGAISLRIRRESIGSFMLGDSLKIP